MATPKDLVSLLRRVSEDSFVLLPWSNQSFYLQRTSSAACHVVSATPAPHWNPITYPLLIPFPSSPSSCHTQCNASKLFATTHHCGAEATDGGTGRGADGGHRVLLTRLHAHQSLQRLLRIDTDLVPAHQGGDAAVASAQDGTLWGDQQTQLGHCQCGAALGVQVRLSHQG